MPQVIEPEGFRQFGSFERRLEVSAHEIAYHERGAFERSENEVVILISCASLESLFGLLAFMRSENLRDGGGKMDVYALRSSDGAIIGQGWGSSGDKPVAADFDVDGKWDVGVFRPSTGSFYILRSTNSALQAQQFGTNGDLPVPAAYVP